MMLDYRKFNHFEINQYVPFVMLLNYLFLVYNQIVALGKNLS